MLKALTIYLKERYGVYEVETRGAYIILRCELKVPDIDQRPFTIAGRVGVWLEGDEEEPVDLVPGTFGQSAAMELDSAILAGLQINSIPSATTLATVAALYFPTATYITFLNNDILVEFQQSSEAELHEKLYDLPEDIANANVGLRYCTGSIDQIEMKRLNTRAPETYDGEADDVNYVKNQQCFYPGTVLTAKTGS